MLKNSFLNLFLFYAVFNWFWTFGKAVLLPFIQAKGLSLSQMILATLLGFIAQGIFLLIVKKQRLKYSWLLSSIVVFLYIILILIFNKTWQFYLISFIGGLATPLFYIIYNILHFQDVGLEKKASRSALMFNLPVIISIIAPVLAGFLIQKNINLFWIFTVISFLIVLYALRLQEDKMVSYKVFDALLEIEPTRILIFLEGVWEALIFAILPIYTLFFIKTPLGYGTFLAYISLVSVLANFILARISDKKGKRALFLYPVTISLALATSFFVFATNSLNLWIVLTGVISFLLPIFWSLSTVLMVDSSFNLELAFPGREIMLTAGRVLGISISFVSFIYEKRPFFIFLFLGLAILLFPIYMFLNQKVLRRFTYR